MSLDAIHFLAKFRTLQPVTIAEETFAVVGLDGVNVKLKLVTEHDKSSLLTKFSVYGYINYCDALSFRLKREH